MDEIKFSKKYEPLFRVLSCRDELKTDPDNSLLKALSLVDTVLISGGRDCFTAEQKIITYNGVKKIKDINKGDLVLTYNEYTNRKEYKPVFKTRNITKSKTIRINLKNGSQIECTPDHEFYHNGGWIEVKHLLSLWYGNMEENI